MFVIDLEEDAIWTSDHYRALGHLLQDSRTNRYVDIRK